MAVLLLQYHGEEYALPRAFLVLDWACAGIGEDKAAHSALEGPDSDIERQAGFARRRGHQFLCSFAAIANQRLWLLHLGHLLHAAPDFRLRAVHRDCNPATAPPQQKSRVQTAVHAGSINR